MAQYRRIRDLREDHDLTQTDVGRMLGMKQQQYARYEQGYQDIPLDALITLARFYHVTTDYLLGLSDDPGGGKAIK